MPFPFALLMSLAVLGLGSARTIDPADDRVELGRALFFDVRLSADGTVSCGSCHQPERAFTDGRRVARGVRGREGTRNTPSLLNVRDLESLFWDGRRESLEAQAREPFVSPSEHGLGSHEELLGTLRQEATYVHRFKAAFGSDEGPTVDRVSAALAAFLRSLQSTASPFDRFWSSGDQGALGVSAKRGLDLFRGRAGCAECHLLQGPRAALTDQRFHQAGVGLEAHRTRLPEIVKNAAETSREVRERMIGQDEALAALGRFVVTGNPADIGKFRTPSLRNVAMTGPYMHDGSVATLEEAIEQELYYRALALNRAVFLTPEEKQELLDFLRSLTDDRFASASPSTRVR